MTRLSAAIRLCWLAAVISQIYAEVSRSQSHFHLILVLANKDVIFFGQLLILINFQILDVISCCDVVIVIWTKPQWKIWKEENFSLNKESFLSGHIVGCYLLFVYIQNQYFFFFKFDHILLFFMGIHVNYE